MLGRSVVALSLLLSAAAQQAKGGEGPPAGGPQCVSLAADHAVFCPSTGVVSRTTYFVCSSEEGEGEQQECRVAVPPFRAVASLALENVHGKGRCAEGETYSMQGDRVWVKGGCTATFAATIGLDEERCAAAQQQLTTQGCEGAVKDIATCQADITAFCGDLKLPGAGLSGVMPPPFPEWRHQWAGGRHGHGPRGGAAGDEEGASGGSQFGGAFGEEQRGGGGHHRGIHGPHGPHGHRGGCGGWRLASAFAPMSPAASLLGQCLQQHQEQLGPECRQTAALQTLTAPPPPMEDAVFWAMLVTAVSGALAASLGFLYFFWQRARLNARRGVAAEKLGSWSTGLFAPDLRSLLPSLLCPWFQSALNQAEVHDRDCSLADVAVNASSHSLVSNTYRTRQALREKYDMPAEPIRDCLASTFCLPCSMAQNTRELEARHGAQQLPADEVVVGQPVPPKEGFQHLMI